MASNAYDPSRLLTRAALFFVGILILFICAIIGVQIWQDGEANTSSWAALTGVVGWATGIVSMIFSHRYGTTQQSANKDGVIAQQARTISGTGNGIKSKDVKIDATDADINISDDLMKTDAQKMIEARKAGKTDP